MTEGAPINETNLMGALDGRNVEGKGVLEVINGYETGTDGSHDDIFGGEERESKTLFDGQCPSREVS